MELQRWLEYLHLLFAFVFVSATLAFHWNLVAARRVKSWAERACLLETNRRLSLAYALPSLIGVGAVGNVLAARLGYEIGRMRPLQIVTALWIVAIIVSVTLEVPLAARLAGMARAAANGGGNGEPVEWSPTLARCRTGSTIQLLLFLVLLGFMVAVWKP